MAASDTADVKLDVPTAASTTEGLAAFGRKPRAPGDGAPLMTGIRVVELATVVAVPAVGRMFSELGAEAPNSTLFPPRHYSLCLF